MKGNMRMYSVSEEDAEESFRWRQMIGCGAL